MRDIILTIAVPVYNMELLLSRCLDSIALVEIKDSIEIIVINDGSTDRSLEVAREYESKYSSFIRVINKQNGGWGTTINRAIIAAKGKYFKTLDSDDWFDSSELIKFVNLLKKMNVDIVATSYTDQILNKENRVRSFDPTLCNKQLEFSEYISLVNYNLELPIHALCYRTGLLQKNDISVSDRFYSDLEYDLLPLCYVNSIYLTQINLYQYFIGREGQSVSIAGYKKNINDYICVVKRLVSHYTSYYTSTSEELRLVYQNNIMTFAKFAYKLLLNCKDTKYEKIIKDFDQFLFETNRAIYSDLNKVLAINIIPYIYLWRKFGINIYKIKKTLK
ncbi:MAG: glycosyltransferase family A protein [bacterium]